MVDADQRRDEIAAAVWRVIRRDGLERASVREVAREAGLSTGSLRHYFRSQPELLVFTMSSVVERVERRIAAVHQPDDVLQAAKLVLAELLPLDDERHAENEVWMAFTSRALVDPELGSLRDEAYDRMREACVLWVGRLCGDAGEDVREVEAERLFAVLDGLAVHAAVRPERATPARLRAVLDHHLDQVASSCHAAMDGAP